MAFSYFDTKSQNTYWIFIFFITFIWGLWKLTKHETFDIQNDENCSDISSDFCASKNDDILENIILDTKRLQNPPNSTCIYFSIFTIFIYSRNFDCICIIDNSIYFKSIYGQ